MGGTEQGCHPKPSLGAERAFHQNPDILRPYKVPLRQAFTHQFCNCAFTLKTLLEVIKQLHQMAAHGSALALPG